MKWLEIIEFNSRENDPRLVEQNFEVLIEKLKEDGDHCVSKVYSRVSDEIDFSIHLHHKSKDIEKHGTSLGRNISSELIKIGSIKHRVWV